ncbi:unnamed protein product, partial [Polarella glacialis]
AADAEGVAVKKTGQEGSMAKVDQRNAEAQQPSKESHLQLSQKRKLQVSEEPKETLAEFVLFAVQKRRKLVHSAVAVCSQLPWSQLVAKAAADAWRLLA